MVVLFVEIEDWHAGEQFGIPSMLNITLYLSVMTVGVGYLSGKGGFWFGAGGFVCYWVLSPILARIAGPEIQSMVSDPNAMRVGLYRPTGIGMLIGAAIGGIIAAFPLIRSAIKSMQSGGRSSSDSGQIRNDEMPIKLLYAAVLLGALAMIAIAFVSSSEMTLMLAASMGILGTGTISIVDSIESNAKFWGLVATVTGIIVGAVITVIHNHKTRKEKARHNRRNEELRAAEIELQRDIDHYVKD